MEYIVEPNLQLARGSLLRIEDGRGLLVYVWSGALWITQDGDGRDRFVGAGGWFRIGARGLTLISALARSAVTLASPHESGFAERIDLVRAGTGIVEPLLAPAARFSVLRARFIKSWAGWFAPQAQPTTASL